MHKTVCHVGHNKWDMRQMLDIWKVIELQDNYEVVNCDIT